MAYKFAIKFDWRLKLGNKAYGLGEHSVFLVFAKYKIIRCDYLLSLKLQQNKQWVLVSSSSIYLFSPLFESEPRGFLRF